MMSAATLHAGIQEQGRVLHALLLREIRTRFGHHRIGYAWAVLEPGIHIGMLYALRSLVGAVSPSSIPMLLWLVSGIVPMFMFRGIFTRTIASARGNRDVLILPQVSVFDIIWARAMLEFVNYSLLLIVMLLLYMALVGPVIIQDPLAVLGCLLLMVMLGIGSGMIILTFTSFFPSTQPLVGGLLRFLYFSSGVFFSVSHIPAQLQPYLLWNPLLHVFETLHGAFFITYQPMEHASDLRYALSCAVVMLVLGMLLVKRFRRTIMEA